LFHDADQGKVGMATVWVQAQRLVCVLPRFNQQGGIALGEAMAVI
jgi:hypothetical protein